MPNILTLIDHGGNNMHRLRRFVNIFSRRTVNYFTIEIEKYIFPRQSGVNIRSNFSDVAFRSQHEKQF